MSRVVALFDATERERRHLDHGAGSLGKVVVEPEPRPGALHDAEVAVVFSFADLPADVWKDAPKLKWIVSLPAGANHVPFDRLPEQARVVSLHGPNARGLAEHAFGLLLAAAKRIVVDHRALARGEFDQSRTSKRLERSTLLVIGAGAIGTQVLRLGQVFGMWNIAVRQSPRAHPFANQTLQQDQLKDAWSRADFIVLAAPLTKETRGLVDAEALSKMRPDAVLVNIARGAVVDHAALSAHLGSHPDFTYATDVWWRYPRPGESFEEPLAALPNVIGTPHSGALVPAWREEMVAAAANVLADIAASGKPDTGPGSPARLESPGESP